MPPLACSNLPMRRLLRAGEGARLVAEQLALEQRLGQAAAVERRRSGAPCARAVVVQAARDQFLAGAGLAVDQHVGAATRPASCTVRRTLLHLRRMADQPASMPCALVQRLAQRAHLQRQRALLERAPHDLDQPLGREGLLDEVVGAARAWPAPPSRCRRGR